MRQAVIAKQNADREAAERAAKAEKEAREAEERMKRELEESALAAEAALAKQVCRFMCGFNKTNGWQI